MSSDPALDPRYDLNGLAAAIQSAQFVALLCHVSPDGDTIGSALALKMMLERLHKRVIVALDGVVPESLFFLPDVYCVRKPKDVLSSVDMTKEGSLAIAVDVGGMERLGECTEIFQKASHNAQLDHHGTNPEYAKINVIDGDAPATAVLVYRLMQAMDVQPQRNEAICLYTGLSTDTGNFVYQSTNAECFSMMARLMDSGFDLSTYSRLLFRRKARPFVALLGKALPTMRFLCGGEVAGIVLTAQQIEDVGATSAHCDGIIDYAIDQAGVKMAYFIRETSEGVIKCSFRALPGYRVDGVSEQFHGGGHQLASGCTIFDMSMDQAVPKIEQAMEQAYERCAKS